MRHTRRQKKMKSFPNLKKEDEGKEVVSNEFSKLILGAIDVIVEF